MGSNDHTPTGSATLAPWKSRGPKEVMSWANVNPELVVALVAQASKVGAYVGFGQSQDASALLLYVKRDRLNERIALEDYKEAKTFCDWVLTHWLNSER